MQDLMNWKNWQEDYAIWARVDFVANRRATVQEQEKKQKQPSPDPTPLAWIGVRGDRECRRTRAQLL